MSNTIERALSALLLICALVIAASVAHREFGKPAQATLSNEQLPRAELTRGWEGALAVGITVGAKEAPVKIVEFADLECPACRRFQGVIHEVLSEYPNEVSLVFVHLPLLGHRFAIQAARAAECAEAKGRFFPFVELIFAKQDSLGIKSWGSFAMEAGIEDSTAISACAVRNTPNRRIEAGMALAQKLQISATPTVLVNGWHFSVPSKENLVRAVKAVRSGKAANDIKVE